MPEVLEELSRRTCEPNPVKESVQWTFSEFKKTHQDAWQETRAAFTSEQWENISIGMELAPSYIVVNTFCAEPRPKSQRIAPAVFKGGCPPSFPTTSSRGPAPFGVPGSSPSVGLAKKTATRVVVVVVVP